VKSSRVHGIAGTGRAGARGTRGLLAALGAVVAAVCLTACGGSPQQPASSVAPTSVTPTAPITHAASARTSTASPASAAPTLSAPGSAQQTAVFAVIRDCSGKPVSRPGEIVLTCADAGWVLNRLSWIDWGQATASARGEWSEKNCTPNCASGGISEYPATVTVSGLRGTAYTRMTVSAPTSPTPKAAFALTAAGPAFISPK
jgi:hypothetical protein